MFRLQSCGAAAVLLTFALRPELVHAELAKCAAIVDDRERLACYDALAQEEHRALLQAPAVSTTTAQATTASNAAPPSELEKRWELRPELKQGIFKLLPYQPLYALLHATTNTNDNPSSPTRVLSAEDEIKLDRAEAKMQLSLKTKFAQDIFGSPADLWFGYSQKSYWQLANSRYSSPFRETNYEPEGILMYPLHSEYAGIHARYAALSVLHESNGRGQALSRSWNRLVGEFAVESGPWSLQVRPWLRVFDASGQQDDNPDIEDYVGRGELIATYRFGGQVVTLNGRHTLRAGSRSRGSAQLDWAFPLAGSINGHLQMFTGYGENLIDYNHRQTTVGLGVSFFD